MGYSQEIRNYALYLLRQGYSPKEISKIIYNKFGVLVPPNTISKWKERYLKGSYRKKDPLSLPYGI